MTRHSGFLVVGWTLIATIMDGIAAIEAVVLGWWPVLIICAFLPLITLASLAKFLGLPMLPPGDENSP